MAKFKKRRRFSNKGKRGKGKRMARKIRSYGSSRGGIRL